MFNKKINGVTIIHVPSKTPLEQINSIGEAMRTRERLQKSLQKKVSKSAMERAYKEFLEVTERYDLARRSEESHI